MYIHINEMIMVIKEFQEPLVKVEDAALATLIPMHTGAFIS